MKPSIAAVVLFALMGCIAVDPNTAIDLMKGSGSASVAPDGSRSFRYVFAKQAGGDRAQHEAMIGQWAATNCAKGYTIAKVETVQGMTVYSGPCR